MLLPLLFAADTVYNKVLGLNVRQELIKDSKFGTIYKIDYFDDDGVHAYARKVFVFPANANDAVVRNYRRLYVNEIDVMRSIHHPNIATIFGSYDNGYDNMEYIMELGIEDTFELFSKLHFFPSDIEFELRDLARQMLNAMEYLHLNNIAHIDIKPENIVAHEEGFKLIDFGFSVSSQYSNCNAGTNNYKAPEVTCATDGRVYYDTFKADIYSLGITLLNLAEFDFSHKSCFNDNLLQKKDSLPFSKSIEFNDFIRRMIHCAPTSRNGIAELRLHVWLIGRQQ